MVASITDMIRLIEATGRDARRDICDRAVEAMQAFEDDCARVGREPRDYWIYMRLNVLIMGIMKDIATEMEEDRNG